MERKRQRLPNGMMQRAGRSYTLPRPLLWLLALLLHMPVSYIVDVRAALDPADSRHDEPLLPSRDWQPEPDDEESDPLDIFLA